MIEFCDKLQKEYEDSVYPKTCYMLSCVKKKLMGFYTSNKNQRGETIPFVPQHIKTIENRDWYVGGYSKDYKTLKKHGLTFDVFSIWKDDTGELSAALVFGDGSIEVYRPSFFAEYKSKVGSSFDDVYLIMQYFDNNSSSRVRTRGLDNAPVNCYIPEGKLSEIRHTQDYSEVTGFSLLNDSEEDKMCGALVKHIYEEG